MKVVLFCGGSGLRLRDQHENIPKPMVPIGYRPILWHVMRYYAHYGHHDFVLCLGYRADVVKDYFLNYNEALSNDFVMSDGGQKLELLGSDISAWRVAFIATGLHASIGERLLAVRSYVEEDEIFLANYADVVTDAPLSELLDDFKRSGKTAAFLCVRPTYNFSIVSLGENKEVRRIASAKDSDLWVNGGFFFFRRDIFDYLRPGEELIGEPLDRLIAEGQVTAYRHEGFWAPMDTLQDMQTLEALQESGRPPWAVWLQRE
jgi:glucose-1-phosphate cytidylyltransferase